MNKRLKIFISLVLALQLLIPSFLLLYNKEIVDNTKSLSTEYSFRLEHLYLDRRLTTEEEDYNLHFSLYGYNLLLYGIDEISVTENPDGFAFLSKRKNTDTGDSWFSYKSLSNTMMQHEDSFTPVEGLTYRELFLTLNQLKNEEDYTLPDRAYVTAKVYKGMFIPTAIYLDGEKILTISIAP